MDFSLDIDDSGRPYATLDPHADEVENAVLLSLHIRRGSWFDNQNFGSRLHEIRTLSNSDVALARQYAVESMGWMKTVGMVRSISVLVSTVRGGLLIIDVDVVRRDGAGVSYKTFFKVV